MKVLAFGTYDAEVHPRVQVLLDGLRAHGADVRELNAPLGLNTAQRVAILHEPWRVLSLIVRLMGRWSRLAIGTTRHRAAWRPDFVLVGYLGHFDVLVARLLFPSTPVILDHLIFASSTAEDRGGASVGRARVLRLLDRLAMRSADVIVLDTEEHRAMVPPSLRSRAVVVPVGATQVWFAAAREPAEPQPALSAVFFGLFTPLQGAPVIGRAVRLLHERGARVRVTLVGSGQDYDAVAAELEDVPSVTWREWVDGHALPGLVAEHDVCLGIFGTTSKALHVVPNKVFQGAAAGRSIITSDTAPQRRVLGDAAWYVHPGDHTSLADALEGLARNPGLVVDLKRRARHRAAQDFTPAAVVRPLLERLEMVAVAQADGP